MNKNRLEAFSDGVLAIIITIMVLDLHAPHDASLAALRPLLGVFLSYVLSFTYVGIYWNNHHHLLQTFESINGRVMWANLHLLFWLSLLPFATSWVGNCGFARMPSALYGVVLLAAAIAYWLLQRAIMTTPDGADVLRKAVGKDWKGNLSPILYLLAIASTFWSPWIAQAIYALVAVIWFVPDRRIARVLKSEAEHAPQRRI